MSTLHLKEAVFNKFVSNFLFNIYTEGYFHKKITVRHSIQKIYPINRKAREEIIQSIKVT